MNTPSFKFRYVVRIDVSIPNNNPYIIMAFLVTGVLVKSTLSKIIPTIAVLYEKTFTSKLFNIKVSIINENNAVVVTNFLYVLVRQNIIRIIKLLFAAVVAYNYSMYL